MRIGRGGELVVIVFHGYGEAFVVEFGEYANGGAKVVAFQRVQPNPQRDRLVSRISCLASIADSPRGVAAIATGTRPTRLVVSP
ncbi:hypothetical protein ATK30_6153 [Amycolatopsis echigonensis]|nr:hypothetical protein ATK30_6153 [Amycolatopsis niigatensis]